MKGKSILRLFAVLASESVPPDFADIRQMTYLETVAGVPAWAVEEGVRKWIAGENREEGENRNFVPKPAELMRLIRIALDPIDRELRAISKTVEAAEHHLYEPSPDERQRVSEGFDRLKAEIPAGKKREAQSEAAKAAAADESLRAMLREQGKSEAEVEEIMNGLKIADPKPGSFQRPQAA